MAGKGGSNGYQEAMVNLQRRQQEANERAGWYDHTAVSSTIEPGAYQWISSIARVAVQNSWPQTPKFPRSRADKERRMTAHMQWKIEQLKARRIRRLLMLAGYGCLLGVLPLFLVGIVRAWVIALAWLAA